MPYEIKYTDKYSGQERVHEYSGNEAGARGWARSLAEENGCKAVAEHVSNGHFSGDGPAGTRRHVVSEGYDRPSRKR